MKNNNENYTEKKNNFIGFKKRKRICKLDYSLNNPSISHFSFDSHFIYTDIDFIKYFHNLSNKNTIKLTKIEFSYLQDKIDEIRFLCSSPEDLIVIDKDISLKLFNYEKKADLNNGVIQFIKNKFQSSTNRCGLSCRKLASTYFNETGKSISKSTINNIIKNKLGLHYLKTTLKSNFLKTDKGNYYSFCFIKIFIKCLIKGFEMIFIDESSIRTINSKYKCWRGYKEQIYFGNQHQHKLNLILAVTKDSVLYHEMNADNTNSDIFLKFMKNINKIISDNPQKKYVIVMDNFSGHRTEELFKYYESEKINILFNVQYASHFNSIELCFRSIKRITYSKLYKNNDEIKLDVTNFLKSDGIKNTLLKNYRETLQQYLLFIQEHQQENINNYKIDN